MMISMRWCLQRVQSSVHIKAGDGESTIFIVLGQDHQQPHKMLARSTFRYSRALLSGRRSYSVKKQAKKFNSLMDKIGDENTKESQKTIKVVRMIGAGSIITVICSLLWASSASGPVKEKYEQAPDLSKDVRSS